jgi:hypothetical protein
MRLSRLSCLPFLAALTACVSTSRPIPNDWLSVPAATRIRSVNLGADGKVAPSSQPAQLTLPKKTIRLVTNAVGPMIANGEKALTEPFMAVDSFDLSDSRGEVVFSAKRDDDFDIGLVAVEGSEISWVPSDPADEVAVKWAPRGSKISYIVRTRFADVVRTLHVPTAFNFSVDFPFARISALGWDPQAERYAVAYSSPNASDAVDILKYSGEARTLAVPPAAKIDVDIQPFAGESILLQPVDIRYGEKLPLVIWRDENVLEWNDARAELMRTARVALVVTSMPPEEALLERANGTATIDTSRIFTVNASVPTGVAVNPDPYLAAGQFRRSGNVVTAPAAVVESFAARFIADQLKRDSPPNGSSR